MSEAPKPVAELSYEQAFTELESIVAMLESEQQTLEETMRLFERGQLLAQFCGALLDNAELKIRDLTDNRINVVRAEQEE
jgi:exodeoxyribonuclease VII small subunit